jgi:hypothetical protein
MKQWEDQKPQDLLAGIAKWDTLNVSMKRYGWATNYPAILRFRHRGPPLLQNGNHRIVIAKQLGIKLIPTFFYFIPLGRPNWRQKFPRSIL